MQYFRRSIGAIVLVLYGYSKIHDDLRSLGERCCPNRAARLTRHFGIKAQILVTRKNLAPMVVSLPWLRRNQIKQSFDILA